MLTRDGRQRFLVPGNQELLPYRIGDESMARHNEVRRDPAFWTVALLTLTWRFAPGTVGTTYIIYSGGRGWVGEGWFDALSKPFKRLSFWHSLPHARDDASTFKRAKAHDAASSSKKPDRQNLTLPRHSLMHLRQYECRHPTRIPNLSLILSRHTPQSATWDCQARNGVV